MKLGLFSVYGRLVHADFMKCYKISCSVGLIGLLNIFIGH